MLLGSAKKLSEQNIGLRNTTNITVKYKILKISILINLA